MFFKVLEALVPPIFIIAVKRVRSCFSDELFDGDDALFQNEVKKVDVYGEYGSGKSTKWVLDNTDADVISVDTSGDWVRSVKTANEKHSIRLNIHFSNVGDVGKWGYPLSYEQAGTFYDYTDHLWKQEKTPQLVLVDGRFRVCCFLTTLKFAEKGTKIFFDDYLDRPQYHFVEKYVRRFKACGRQCMFVVPPKTEIDMAELEKDINAFRYVLD